MDELPDLVAQCQKGDKDAFGKIYNLHFQKIYRYCFFNLKDRDLAQDLVQETFLKAWRGIGGYSEKKGGSFQAFLFKIARNLIIDNSRKKKLLKLEDWEHIEKEDNLGDEIDKEKNTQIVREALLKLGEMDRQIILLRYFEELPLLDVAKILKIKDGALRVRVHRVLEKLKGIIEDKKND